MRVYASAEMTLTDTNDGISVTGIDRYYMASSSSSGITVDSKGWEPDPQETNPISRYHWSYEVVNYSDGAAIPSKPAVIGVYGKEGKEGIDAVTVSLSSEAHTFAGTESKAIASSITIDISAFKGNQRIPTSIGTVTGGIPGQIDYSELGRGKTNNKLVINVTSSLDKANGTLSIPIVADGRTFNKVFSWSVAFKGVDGTTTYTWIRYADTPTSGMSDSALDKKYIGLSFNQTTQTESNNYNDYQWSLMPQNIEVGGRNLLLGTGEGISFTDSIIRLPLRKEVFDGLIGEYITVSFYAEAEIDGQRMDTYFRNNDTNSEMTNERKHFTLTTDNLRYSYTFKLSNIANINSIDFALRNTSSSGGTARGNVVVSKLQIEYGNTATDWTPAPEDIQSEVDDTKEQVKKTVKTITEEYYQSTSETSQTGSDWTTTAPTWKEGKFIFIRSKITYVDGTTDYTPIVNITGAKGDPGKDGNPGKDGVGIQKTEVHYASSTSGTTRPSTGWNLAVPSTSPGDYIWTRTTWVYTDGDTEEGYSVSRIGKDGNTGDDGAPGKDGVGIKSTVINYATSSSGTIKPTSGWTSTVPSVTAGNYLWTKTTWTYTDNDIEEGYSVSRIGKDGTNGTNGKDGTGIKSAVIAYTIHTSGTSTPTSGWASTVPSPAKGKYMWTRTITTYTDNTTSTTYSVAYQATDGQRGDDGSDGNGISSTTVDYAQTTSGTTTPTSWSGTRPSPKQGQYLWSRTIIKYTNGTSSTAYNTSYSATDGQSQWVHIRYSPNPTGSGMTNNPSSTTKYVGIAVTKSATAPAFPEFTWSKFIGENGAPGDKGDDGTTTYTWIRYADEKDGTGINNSPSGKKFIGLAHNQTTPNESNNPNDYQWSAMYDEEAFKGVGLADKTEVLSGTEIYTDKADDSVVHVEIDGKSVGGGSGKNVALGSDKMLTSTNAGGTTGYKVNKDAIASFIGKKVTVSFEIRATGKTGFARGVFRGSGGIVLNSRSDKDYGVSMPLNNDWNYYHYTFTLTQQIFDDVEDVGVKSNQWVIGNTEGIQHEVRNLQLEGGDSPTKWEPPAPTPDYPIEIHSLNDFDVVSSVGRENILLDSEVEVKNNVYNMRNYTPSTPLVQGEEYTMTICATPARGVSSIPSYLSGGYRVQARFDFNGTSKQIVTRTFKADYHEDRGPEDANSYKDLGLYRFPNNETVTEDTTIHWVKVEKGNTATSYSPAPEDIIESDNHPLIDKINLSLSEPLRSVGDVKDRLFRDSDGMWKVERKFIEYQADGSENWSHHSNYGRFDMLSSIGADTGSIYNGTNSHFLSTRASNNDKRNITWVFDGVPRVVHHGVSSSAEMKSYIKDQYDKKTPVTWIMEMVTPTIEILPQPMQDKLNNLRSFQDSDYVYTVINDKTDIISERLKPTLHATFKGGGWYSRWKTEKKLDNHQDQLDKTVDTEQLNTAVADLDADKLSIESYEQFLASYDGERNSIERSIESVAEDIGKALARTETIETTLGDGAQDWIFTNTKIRMSDEGITLGEEASGTYLQISSDKISFFAGATDEVAYVSGGMLYINKAVFVQSIQVSEYLLSKELDGHLTFRFVGEG